MAAENEKVRINLNIADEQVRTVVSPSEEEGLRQLAKEVTGLYNRWRVSDPTRTKTQVLAMVAFQYAKLYHDQLDAGSVRELSLRDFIEKFEERLDKIVIDV